MGWRSMGLFRMRRRSVYGSSLCSKIPYASWEGADREASKGREENWLLIDSDSFWVCNSILISLFLFVSV